MKNIITALLFLVYLGVSNVQGQTVLDTAAKEMNLSIKIPFCFNASGNEELTFVTEVAEEEYSLRMAQYRFAPVSGNIAFQVLFGMVDAILEHKSDEYLAFVFILPGKCKGRSGDLSFNRIKWDLGYGKPLEPVSEKEESEMSLKLTHYPKEQAQKMFNADIMVDYPVDLMGNSYRDKYTKCKAVVAAKGGRHIYLYLMMTDKNVKNFDTYLKDLDKVFWFNE